MHSLSSGSGQGDLWRRRRFTLRSWEEGLVSHVEFKSRYSLTLPSRGKGLDSSVGVLRKPDRKSMVVGGGLVIRN